MCSLVKFNSSGEVLLCCSTEEEHEREFWAVSREEDKASAPPSKVQQSCTSLVVDVFVLVFVFVFPVTIYLRSSSLFPANRIICRVSALVRHHTSQIMALSRRATALLVCDIQDRFSSNVYKFGAMSATSARVIRFAKVVLQMGFV